MEYEVIYKDKKVDRKSNSIVVTEVSKGRHSLPRAAQITNVSLVNLERPIKEKGYYETLRWIVKRIT